MDSSDLPEHLLNGPVEIPEHLRLSIDGPSTSADRVVRHHDSTDSTTEAVRLDDGTIHSSTVDADGVSVTVITDNDVVRSEIRRIPTEGSWEERCEEITYDDEGAIVLDETWISSPDEDFRRVETVINYARLDSNSEPTPIRRLNITRHSPTTGFFYYRSELDDLTARIDVNPDGTVTIGRITPKGVTARPSNRAVLTLRQRGGVPYEIDDVIENADRFADTPISLSDDALEAADINGKWKRVVRVKRIGPLRISTDYQVMPPMWKWPTVKASAQDRRIAFGWRYHGLGVSIALRPLTPDPESP